MFNRNNSRLFFFHPFQFLFHLLVLNLQHLQVLVHHLHVDSQAFSLQVHYFCQCLLLDGKDSHTYQGSVTEFIVLLAGSYLHFLSSSTPASPASSDSNNVIFDTHWQSDPLNRPCVHQHAHFSLFNASTPVSWRASFIPSSNPSSSMLHYD